MKVVIKKWGNSASVRLPVAIMQAAHLELDQEVNVREEGGVILIEPIRPIAYDLESMLNDISEENVHAEIDTGNAVGREIW